MRYPLDSLLRTNKLYSNRKSMLIYMRKVRSYIQKQEAVIAKLKTKIKTLSNKEVKQPEPEMAKNDEEGRDELVSSYLDDIKKAATEAMIKQMGLQFEPCSGLYYDATTGYYFNPEYNLYYDGNNGCYLKYNEESFEYEFYSQAATVPSTSRESKKDKSKYDKSRKTHVRRGKKYYGTSDERSDTSEDSNEEHRDKEDGELSRSDSSYSSEVSQEQVFSIRKDIANKYPPSLRLVIKETDVSQLKKGSLFIVTYKGGTLGREGEQHDIIVPDINVSKNHLKFSYNRKRRQYECQDLGSRNGTIVNGERLSESKVKSSSIPLKHESIIVLHKTKILCHIHQGRTTCNQCEPGLIQTDTASQSDVIENRHVHLSHKAQLKQLQRRYGLEKEKYVKDEAQNNAQQSYNDRADERRKKVGSSGLGEKTESTSLDTSIASTNKGFKLLTKLGWNEGESLGKSSSGILEPVPIVTNKGTRGLGNAECGYDTKIPTKMKNKIEILEKTQKRYLECNK